MYASWMKLLHVDALVRELWSKNLSWKSGIVRLLIRLCLIVVQIHFSVVTRKIM